MTTETTAQRIRKLRRAMCISQAEMSREMKVSIGTISCYETGKREPGYPTIRKMIALAKKHGIKIGLDDIRPE